MFHIINQLSTLSEQLKNALGKPHFLKYYSSQSLVNSSFMSEFLVNTRNQPPRSPNLISHLVHINNPPSRTGVSLV